MAAGPPAEVVDLADLHDDLRAVARNLLGKTDTPDWAALAEAGWLGLEVPESLEGAGATIREVAVILHEMGRAATASSYLGSVALGVAVLNLIEPETGRDEVLHQISSGATRVAVAMSTTDGGLFTTETPFRLERTGGGIRLEGQASFVPDVMEADRLLLLASDDEGTPVVVETYGGAPGLKLSSQPVVDATRRFGLVAAEGATVPQTSVWRFASEPARSTRLSFDRGAVAVACDSLGLAEAMMETTVAYAQVRKQFERPIGSFQAVKHACADMLVQVKVSRQLLSSAVDAVADQNGDFEARVSMAKSYVCEAAVKVVGKAIQLHGGIGYTWDSGLHVYLKRAVLNRSLFGSPAAHRRRLARRYS